MKIEKKNILVVGLGKSGVAVARFLKKNGANVTITDKADENNLGQFVSEIREIGIKEELGYHRNETFCESDLIVLSPGVPDTISPVLEAKKNGVEIIGEIELAASFIKEPIIAVTGTNGKTTTTTLLGEMLKKSGFKVFVGGNIGNPLIDYTDSKEKADVVVVEVSSFQLDTISAFRPHVSVLLNITADHLDRYKDFNEYVMSKGRIFENQDHNDLAIVNGRDIYARKTCRNIRSRRLFFNSEDETENKAYINGRTIKFNLPDCKEEILDIHKASLSGAHNLENISAAGLAALAVGGTINGMQSAIDEFQGLSHRLEYVDTINGVRFYDDSKATNVDAVARAIETFSEPVVLIMGGRDKMGGYHKLESLVKERVKTLVVIGEAKDNIENALGAFAPVKRASSMEEAVSMAWSSTEPGDVMLLSPACSSFDMFQSYAQRGNAFSKEVKYLKVKEK
ncbi:MAG: UDP-N-acetylmuramoyl-L-alanine--D-glutamate ligase [Desulfobacteraceae bacterium]|nr:UDP-N-acetylmuramoyl-L-alanine--D-glutamate ligase [Desulfobacteraceae bacterium]